MNRSIFYTLLLVLSLCFSKTFSQKLAWGDSGVNDSTTNPACGTDALLNLSRENFIFKTREQAKNRQIFLSNPPSLDEVLILPVVVHIISDSPNNILDQVIRDGIKDLNDAFSKKGNYSGSKGADSKIQFCLAKTDPDNGITTGITRTISYYGLDHNVRLEQQRLKKLIQWDPDHYINIWFIKNLEDEIGASFSCKAPGTQWVRSRTGAYSSMPFDGINELDGIVTPTFGVTLAHEMGHYLGLYHTFEGGCRNNDCSQDGDKVCDTPPDVTRSGTCNRTGNSCFTDSVGANPGFTSDQNDSPNNLMDYTGCPKEFTQGQVDRMRKTIVSLRSGLLVNKCKPPCNQNITASFTGNNAYPVPGTTVTYTNTSAGANSYQWLVNNVQIATSVDFSYTFTDTGKTKITLKAFNGATCFASYSNFVRVTCGVAARFWVDKRVIASEAGLYTDSILFTNTSVNAASCKWLLSDNLGMSDQVISTNTGNLLYTFGVPALYTLRLVATNGSCSDTTDPYDIPVNDPTPDAITSINTADCYQDTAIRVSFNICNKGYMPLRAGAPVSFYDGDPTSITTKKLEPTFFVPNELGGAPVIYCCWGFVHILNTGKRQINTIYVVYGDSGKTVPIKMPNTSIVETNYNNNSSFYSNFRFSVSASPTEAVLAPEDTLTLTAVSSPSSLPSTYLWSPAYNLSCANCPSPDLIADSTSIKQVIGTSFYGCTDTAYVSIVVPPAYDFSIALNDVQCAAADDSLYINFSLFNQFKRDFIPKGLKVSFYNGDPSTPAAVLLPPVFSVPATLRKKPFNYTTFIKGMPPGKLFAVVNDDGSSIPVKLPNDTTFKETNYGNNAGSFNYTRLTATTGNNGPVCERDTIKLSVTSIPGAGFAWSGPAGFISDQPAPFIANTSAVNSGYYIATASKYGCTSVPDSTLVTIYAAPVITADYVRPLCETRLLQFNANSTNGVAYKWSGPNFTSDLQNPAIASAAFTNSGPYSLLVTSSNGCTSLPNNLNVVVNPLPLPAFTDTITCLPSTTAFFYNTSTIQSGSIASYSWNFGDAATGNANSSTLQNPSHSFSTTGNFIVTLTATSDSGCSVATSNNYNRFHTKPKADFSFTPTTNLCVNDIINLTDNSNGADGNIVLWKWLFGDGVSLENSTAIAVSHRYSSFGNYTLSLEITNNFGCGDTLRQAITAYALPVVDAGPTQYVLLGNSTDLKATASGNGLTYRWTPATYLSDAAVKNPVVVRAQDDILYTLTVTSINKCVASDTTFIKILKPLVIPNVFSPNGDGINDVWNVRYLADYPGATMDIFDRYGRIVHHSNGYLQPWDGRNHGNPVPVGVYYYIITPKNGAATVNGSVTVVR